MPPPHTHDRDPDKPKASRLGRVGNVTGTALGCALVLITLVLPAPALAEAALPYLGNNLHLGVATCASSTCHGAAAPRDASDVLQNEYLTWHRRDAHSRAYQILLEDRSQRIARRLGLGPPEQADACLDCHADNVPVERRGDEFQISDGVGCEACHGGAERWIRSHADERATHADNLQQGLYPSEDPAARTRLCMSCHYSHPRTPMTHRLMAAGHPPLLFDLDTFTQIQPAHHVVDRDYRRRKGEVSAATAWAIGEATGSALVLDTIARRIDADDGLFPELYYFDCAACHHDLGTGWPLRPTGLPAGSVPLEDASLRMMRNVLAGVDPERAAGWARRLSALHQATRVGVGRTREVAADFAAFADQTAGLIGRGAISAEQGRTIMREIIRAGVRSHFTSRSWADQSAMALASLVSAAGDGQWLDEDRQRRLERGLDRLFQALEDPRAYSPWRYRESLRAFGAALD